VIDPHHAGVWGRRYGGRRTGRAVDDGHLAKELALAERDDHGLAGAVHLGDLDLAVEHHEQFPPGRAFLKNDVIYIKLVDALLDGHGDRCLSGWLVGRSMLIGKQTGANGTGKRSVIDAAGQHGQSNRGCLAFGGPKPGRMSS
jgi:hypothetical protein